MSAARQVLLDWAESGGFAALHGGGATNEAIVEDLLAFLEKQGLAIMRPLKIYDRSIDQAARARMIEGDPQPHATRFKGLGNV